MKLKLPKRDHVPVSSIIEWDRHRWFPIAGHCQKTLDRIKRGRAEFGDTFVMPYYGSGSGETGRSINRPLGTVPTRDRWAIVRGDQMRMFAASEYRAVMGFQPSYRLPSNKKLAVHLLGNAVCPPVPAEIIPLLN